MQLDGTEKRNWGVGCIELSIFSFLLVAMTVWFFSFFYIGNVVCAPGQTSLCHVAHVMLDPDVTGHLMDTKLQLINSDTLVKGIDGKVVCQEYLQQEYIHELVGSCVYGSFYPILNPAFIAGFPFMMMCEIFLIIYATKYGSWTPLKKKSE